jgi:hypothetical protein
MLLDNRSCNKIRDRLHRTTNERSQEMKVSQFTIYTKSVGVEIGPYEKRQEGKPREGRISLRFFKMEGGSPPLRFVAEPAEGFELFRMINKVFLDGGKETLTHKFESSSGETVTRLTLEKYDRNGKPGYALAIQRADDTINVSASSSHFLYAGEFLRHLSIVSSWTERFDPS